jgi:bidirectional [NiFe] hydrogenase diaphorase subunit
MLDATIKRHQYQQDALIEILHRACELFGYLELDLLLYIAHSLKLPPSRVYGVATFYHLFSLAPKGVHNCVVCTGTACYVKGAQTILTNVEQFTQIHAGETTPNGQISLMTARCLGACGIAPAVVFDGTVLGNQTPDSVCEKVRAWWQNGTK